MKSDSDATPVITFPMLASDDEERLADDVAPDVADVLADTMDSSAPDNVVAKDTDARCCAALSLSDALDSVAIPCVGAAL